MVSLKQGEKVTLNNNDLLEMYRLMIAGRAFDQDYSKRDGGWHQSTGEEGVIVGAFYSLQKEDIAVPHYRGIPIVQYMRGAPFRKIFASLTGKVSGYNCGRFHQIRGPFELNILGTLSGTLGPNQCIATGAALAIKLEKTDRVVVTSFGDGTSSRGDFHESVNFAAIYKLPVVFVCQNNQYAISTRASKALSCRSIADRALGYGIPGIEVDGNDVLEVYETVNTAIERARRGEGPSLIDAKTYRLSGHWVADSSFYRSQEELDDWKEKDPLARLQSRLINIEKIPESRLQEIQKEINQDVLRGSEEEEKDPFPGEECLGIGDIFAPLEAGGYDI